MQKRTGILLESALTDCVGRATLFAHANVCTSRLTDAISCNQSLHMSRMRTRSHKRTHARTHTQPHARTHKRMDTRTCTSRHSSANEDEHTHARARTHHTRTQICTYTRLSRIRLQVHTHANEALSSKYRFQISSGGLRHRQKREWQISCALLHFLFATVEKATRW